MQKFYYTLIGLFPWILVSGIFQQSYWKFQPLRLQNLLQGAQFWDKITVIDLYTALIFLIFCLGFLLKKIVFLPQRKFPRELSFGVIFILFAGLLEILLQKIYPPVLSSPAEYFRSLFLFPILLILLFFKTLPEKNLKNLVKNYFFSSGTLAFLALLQYFFYLFPGDQFDFMQRLTWPYLDFLTLKATSANWIAFFLTPAVILLFIQIFTHFKTQKTWQGSCLNLIILGLTATALYLMQSYSAYGAIFGTLIFFFWQSLPKKQFVLALLILSLTGGGMFFAQKNSAKYQILAGEKVYKYANSWQIRQEIYHFSLETLKEHPFLGVGLNQYQSYFRANHLRILKHPYPKAQIPPHAHNFFLSFWLSLGLLGLIGILILIGGIFWRFKFNPQFPALFALLAIMLHGILDAYYWKQEIAYLFWLVIFWCYLYQLPKMSTS